MFHTLGHCSVVRISIKRYKSFNDFQKVYIYKIYIIKKAQDKHEKKETHTHSEKANSI